MYGVVTPNDLISLPPFCKHNSLYLSTLSRKKGSWLKVIVLIDRPSISTDPCSCMHPKYKFSGAGSSR